MLTDAQAKRAKGADKPYKLTDGGGLYLLVSPTGNRSWRLKYRFGQKEKLLTFGSYPDVSLIKARELREKAKAALREHRDPAVEKKQAVAAARIGASNTFEACARAWHELNRPRWSAVHAGNVLDSLEADLFPAIGAMPIKDVTEALLLDALRKVEKRGAIETAHRIRQRASDVFAYAAAAGLRTGDPAAVVKSLLKPKPPDAVHLATALIADATEFHTFDGALLKLNGIIQKPSGGMLTIRKPPAPPPSLFGPEPILPINMR